MPCCMALRVCCARQPHANPATVSLHAQHLHECLAMSLQTVTHRSLLSPEPTTLDSCGGHVALLHSLPYSHCRLCERNLMR